MNPVFGKTRCGYTIQHLNYGQILGDRIIDPCAVLSWVQTGVFLGDVLTDMRSKELKVSQKFMFFAKWQQMEFFPKFYNKKIIFDDFLKSVEILNRKFKVKCQLLPLGNTSRPLEVAVFEDDEPAVHLSALHVNVDPVTRQPSPMHETLKKFLCPENCPPIELGLDKSPPKCRKRYDKSPTTISYSSKSVICYEHIDRFNHTNNTAYVKLCFECLFNGFKSGVFGPIGSIFDYDIRRISILYLKESVLDDEVVTTVWRDSVDPWCFCFHSTKDGNLLCQTEIEFFEPKFGANSNL